LSWLESSISTTPDSLTAWHIRRMRLPPMRRLARISRTPAVPVDVPQRENHHRAVRTFRLRGLPAALTPGAVS
jgi:hypothetical protein